jgi:hypothetical protein
VSTLDTITVPDEPLFTTRSWSDAVAAAAGVCTCTGLCGSAHKSSAGRCVHSLSGGYRLFLTDAGALLCARCFDAVKTVRRKAERAAAAPAPENLFDLLAASGQA